MKRSRLGALLALAFASSQVQAAYVLTPLSVGQNTLSLNPGESFVLDLNLQSTDGFDQHNSAIFQLVFTMPGLELLSYNWASPYETGSIFDDSTPSSDVLPMLIDDQTLAGPNYPDGVVDIEFSNVLMSGNFQSGNLLSLELRMPDTWDSSPVSIFVVPDTFADGFSKINTTAGQGFTIIPNPGSLTVLGVSFVFTRRRR